MIADPNTIPTEPKKPARLLVRRGLLCAAPSPRYGGRLRRIWAAFLVGLVLFLSACDGKELPEISSSTPESSSSLPPISSVPEPEPEPDVLDALPLAVGFNALTGLGWPEGMEAGARPVAVMVDNTAGGMPQRGLAAADVLLEMPIEGSATRLMALYADYRSVPQVGPVRATQDQFVQFALPLAAIQAHIDGNAYAKNLLSVTGTQDIDGLYLGKTAFWFDAERNLPHLGDGKLNEYCWFTDAGLLWQGVEAAQISPTGEVRSLFWFAGEAAQPADKALSVAVRYSDAAATGFTYNADTGLYTKTWQDAPHTDEDGTPLAFQNLLLLQAGIGPKESGIYKEFDLSGGSGWYFTAGGVQPITWTKGGPFDALRLFGEDGKELRVQPGKSYIGFVPAELENAVQWEPPPELPPDDSTAPDSSVPPQDPPVSSEPPVQNE